MRRQLPYNLPGGQNLNCTFSATPPNGNPGTSLARVSTSGNVQGAETSTPFAFAGSPVLINDQIDVQDSDGGQWNFTDDGSTVYNKDYTCGDEGVNNYTATIVQTGQSDGAGVTITCLPGGGVGSGVLTITGETDPPAAGALITSSKPTSSIGRLSAAIVPTIFRQWPSMDRAPMYMPSPEPTLSSGCSRRKIYLTTARVYSPCHGAVSPGQVPVSSPTR